MTKRLTVKKIDAFVETLIQDMKNNSISDDEIFNKVEIFLSQYTPKQIVKQPKIRRGVGSY